jgi:hypothetical protein
VSDAILTTGGIIVRVGERHYVIAEENVLRVVPCPPVQRVPGAPPELLGIAMEGGTVVPVLSLATTEPGAPLGPLLLCRAMGEPLGLCGLRVVETGFFPLALDLHALHTPGAVTWRGEVIEPLDLVSLLNCVQPGTWAGTSGAAT